jgi:hypothetical protein
VGSARLTCGQHPSQTPFAQLSPKREDLTREYTILIMVLVDQYAAVADWDLSTRKAYEGYIRRVIKPALGNLQVRKIRGPLPDLLYAQLRRCGDPGCTGKKFVEHRTVPTLGAVTPSGR